MGVKTRILLKQNIHPLSSLILRNHDITCLYNQLLRHQLLRHEFATSLHEPEQDENLISHNLLSLYKTQCYTFIRKTINILGFLK